MTNGPFSDAHLLEVAGLTEYATLVQRVMLSHGLRWRSIRPNWTNTVLQVDLEDGRAFEVPLDLDRAELQAIVDGVEGHVERTERGLRFVPKERR